MAVSQDKGDVREIGYVLAAAADDPDVVVRVVLQAGDGLIST